MEASAQVERPGIYPRGSEEFSRVLAFSDGIFAIAMTLLVVTVELPELSSPDISELANSLADLETQIFSFFLSFAVIGFYWLAHHRFIANLAAMDRGLIVINLIYLALIAFMPFPTDVLGNYFENPISIALYAAVVCIVSGLEAVLLRHAYHRRLLLTQPSDEVYEWAWQQSLAPLLPFLVSIPVAFASTTVASLLWILAVPISRRMDRRKPEGADALTGG